MKSNGAIMATVVPIFKEEKPFDAAALKSVFDGMGVACSGWATFWGADTQKGETIETFAKAEVWTDAAGFEAAGNASYDATQKLMAVTDLAGLKAAFPAVGEGCKGCHDKFRRPKE
jgi:cytochrome c556